VTAGYSGTPLAAKLGIKGGLRVAVLNAPEGFDAELAPLPDGVELRSRLPPRARAARQSGEPRARAARQSGEAAIDLALVFVTRRAELERRFPAVAARLPPAGSLWVAWPKRSSGRPTDLTEDVLREVGLPLGWVDTKVCAVNEIWSGLRFVLRLENRP
jgi:hypothetical protein